MRECGCSEIQIQLHKSVFVITGALVFHRVLYVLFTQAKAYAQVQGKQTSNVISK